MPRTNRVVVVLIVTISILTIGHADARPTSNKTAASVGSTRVDPTRVGPIKAPASLLRARAVCPNTATPVQCRAALRRAYAALEWNRKVRHELRQRLLQAVRPVEHITSWVCIHEHEGAWNDIADPFWGGLQMDRDFMHTYGPDMIARYSSDGTLGYANEWTPREQMIVAERAYDAGRGFHPWPNTARACGLL